MKNEDKKINIEMKIGLRVILNASIRPSARPYKWMWLLSYIALLAVHFISVFFLSFTFVMFNATTGDAALHFVQHCSVAAERNRHWRVVAPAWIARSKALHQRCLQKIIDQSSMNHLSIIHQWWKLPFQCCQSVWHGSAWFAIASHPVPVSMWLFSKLSNWFVQE